MRFCGFVMRFSPLFALWPIAVLAQPDPALQLRQENQSRQRQESLGEVLPSRSADAAPALVESPAQVAEPQPLLRSPSILLRANDLVLPEALVPLLARYDGLDLGKQRITLLLRQLNAQLVRQGLVTSRARLVRLDAQTNTLEIELVPGRIEAIRQDGQPGGAGLATAFPGQADDLLVLQDVEQGVQQIQRLRRYQAELKILPGQSPDTSLLDVHLTESRPWWFQAAGDNLGSKATGRARARATLSLDNPFGYFEAISLTALKSRDSDAAVASVSVPFGYNTVSASWARSHFRQTLPGELREQGGSHTAMLAWNRVLHLSATGKDAAELSLSRNASEREIEGYALDPEKLSVVKFTMNRLRQGQGWRAWGELGVSRGVSWFGANADAGHLDAAAPHARFTKLEVHGGLLYQPDRPWGHYVGQFDAQTARTGLYGTEQFRLGGLSTVRGYDEGVFSGDRGLLLRNEWLFPASAVAGGSVTPLLFLDHGAARLIDGPVVRLTGAGGGVRLAAKHWAADLYAAHPLHHSAGIDARGWQLHATVRIDL